MKMCGATNSFIRWPFVIEGLLLGLFGAIVAFLFQWAVYAAVYNMVLAKGASALFTLIEFRDIWLKVLGVFLAAGAIIGACGSGFAIRRFLKV